MRLATLLLTLLVVTPTFAQTPGNCQLGTAEVDLVFSDVRARLFNAGNLFFGNTTVSGNGYLVPASSYNSPIFAAGIWVGGLIGSDLRVAGSTYNDFEFWPGPLEPGATLPNPDDCSAYDRFWLVDVFDVQRYDETGEASADLATWPVEHGAPVINGDGVEGNYNLEGGDRPAIYGSQTAFWVMNDVGNEHERTLTEPIGLEVRVTAFVSVEADLEQQTFYRYELVNRNDAPFEDARFGLFVDPDLGDATDDYVGSDSSRSMAFVYNASEMDAVYGTPPAAGYDFLSGADVSMYFESYGGCGPTNDPCAGDDIYEYLSGLWNDGTPMTEGGNGYATGGPVVEWAFPGDPVTEQFWSEVNVDGSGADNPSGDRRHVISSEAFTLAPGESRTFDLAILFAQGDDHLDSVAELRAVSDAVQFRYDDGLLFTPGPQPPPSGTLPTPELLSPEDGATFVDEPVSLSWEAVPGAERYRVEVATDPEFYDVQVTYSPGPAAVFRMGGVNEVETYHWRVKAVGFGFTSSAYSAVREFTYYDYVFDLFGEGTGIVETAYPGADVCPEGNPTGDPGCADYDGNTVWLHPSTTGDYVLTNSANNLQLLIPYRDVIDGDDFEMRFTEDCTEAGACLAVAVDGLGDLPQGEGLVASVPFELWNTGAEDDPSDDVRMIPVVRSHGGAEPSVEWADTFPAEQDVLIGEDVLTLPVTQRVLGVMPDREDGYALFAEAAQGFGGVGAVYDHEDDGDMQVDTLPTTGEPCRIQHYYVDFCYRGASSLFVAPLGGNNGVVLADLAGDGTTPPAGTTIRFDALERLLPVGAEEDGPGAQPEAFALEAAYPNPFRTSATVGYRLGAAAEVRLAVYDVLGRRVAVLAEGPQGAGAHRVTFEARELASGVYLVVLEAAGQRQTRKVMLVR